jgi:hypothetical protein
MGNTIIEDIKDGRYFAIISGSKSDNMLIIADKI